MQLDGNWDVTQYVDGYWMMSARCWNLDTVKPEDNKFSECLS